MLNGSIKAVLFDLDDTLYEEMTFVISGFRAVSCHLCDKFHLSGQELLSGMIEVLSKEGRGKVFDRVLERYELYQPHVVEELVGIYRTHRPQIHLYPDVIPTLQELKKLGIKVGIITDGLHSVQKNKVESLGLLEYMDIIIYTDERGRDYWKPHPAAFQHAINVLAVKPNEAIYVGNDPKKDFTGPNSLGMLTVHLRRNDNPAETSCEASIHIADLTQVIQVFGVEISAKNGRNGA